MTIHYPNGTVLEAVLVSRGSDTLRAWISGDDDARAFTLIGGTWISEECEPVRIEFAWQHREETRVPSETECVCSKELASRLTSMLLVGTEVGDLIENMLYVSSAQGHRVRISEGRLTRVVGEVGPDCPSESALVN